MEDCNYSGAREWGRGGGGRGERDGLGIQLHHFLRSYDSVFFRTRQCPRASCLGDFSIFQLAQLRKVQSGEKKMSYLHENECHAAGLSTLAGVWNLGKWSHVANRTRSVCHTLPCPAMPCLGGRRRFPPQR